ETAQTKPGVLASLRPHVSVPIQARQPLAQLTPVTLASWALGGFYFSLMPALVRLATGATLPIVSGLVVAALTFSSVIAVLSLRNIPAERVLLGAIPALALGVATTLGGVHARFVTLMLLGTMVSGLGFGAVFSGTLRTVLPLANADERAGLLWALPQRLSGVHPPRRSHRISGPDRRSVLGRRRLRISRDTDGGCVAGGDQSVAPQSPYSRRDQRCRRIRDLGFSLRPIVVGPCSKTLSIGDSERAATTVGAPGGRTSSLPA